MFEQAAVAATHITDTLRLLVQRPVENLDDDLIHFPEIRLVRAAAGPDIHAAIDQELNAALVKTRNARIAKQKHADHIERRQVRDRDAVRGRNLRRISATGGQLSPILVASDPALSGQEIEQAGSHVLVDRERPDAYWPLFELRQHAAARERDHGWTDQHAINVFANEVGDLGGQWIARRGQSPARVRSTDQLAQRRQNWSVGAVGQEVFKENGF